MKHRIPVFPVLLFAAAPLAALELHPLFGEGAVLQRGVPVPVWGSAAPGAGVEVRFAGITASGRADASGRWEVRLPAMEARSEPSDLVASSGATLTVRNVVVGDVWLASGQSNMDAAMVMPSVAGALAESRDPLLRFFKVTKAVSAEPISATQAAWQESTPENTRRLSAVAYFFAREVRRSQGVPVGILHSAWGGTPIRTWMPLASFQAPPPIERHLREFREARLKHESARGQPELMEAYYRDMKDWETNVDAPFREARRTWEAAAAEARAQGKSEPERPRHARPEPVMPDPIAMPAASKRPQISTITYNAMIAPLAPYALRGVLWYQGEADDARGLEYRDLLPRMIAGWRQVWGRQDLPFLIVQLPGFRADPTPVAVGATSIAWLREAQDLAARKVPGVELAVTIDIGDQRDVHPDNKEETGRRLALVARERVLGEPVVGTGPRYHSHEVRGGEVKVRFERIGGGLTPGQAPWVAKGAAPLPADRLVGFFVAGEDARWVEADARVEGATVVVSSPKVPAPVAVRYAWANTPRANLYNREGLPAAPFRTDDWD